MRAKARQQCRMIRIALVTTLSALALAACAPQRAVLVPEPVAAPVAPVSPSKQISRAGDNGVKETAQGYLIESTNELVAYSDKRVKNSPDGEYHWCAHQAGIDAGHTICLFVPPKGF